MKITFSSQAWEEYLYRQTQDRRTLRRVNQLVEDIARNGNTGIGKPKALRHGLSGYRSRRIEDEHRLVCKLTEEGNVLIAQCRYHYDR